MKLSRSSKIRVVKKEGGAVSGLAGKTKGISEIEGEERVMGESINMIKIYYIPVSTCYNETHYYV